MWGELKAVNSVRTEVPMHLEAVGAVIREQDGILM